MKINKLPVISKIAFFCSAVILFFSCTEGFFDKRASDKITPDQHYQAYIEVNTAYYGAFSLMQEASINLVVLNGLLSDMMDVTENATSDLRELNKHEASIGNQFIDPSIYYEIIVNTNEILANIDTVKTRDKDFDEFELFYNKGILISLRSWAYFTIARLYGEAVYFNDNIEKYQGNTEFIKLDRRTMIDTLISQVKRYIKKDPEIYIDTWTVNKKALLAEMYLDINQYDSAWYYAKGALEEYGNDSKVYKLDRQFDRFLWQNIFIGATNNPFTVMTAVPFSLDDNQYNSLEDYFYFRYRIKPSPYIINLFNSQTNNKGDATGDIYRGLNVSYEIFDENKTRIKKYSLEEGNSYSADNIITRAADIHLVMAEALNRMGDTTSAMIFLNNGFKNTTRRKPQDYFRWSGNLGVRGRVLLSNLRTPPGDLNSAILQIEDYIIRERAMELAFEGKRWFDLVRIARRRNNPDYLANKVASKYTDPNVANAVRSKLRNKENWYLPKDY